MAQNVSTAICLHDDHWYAPYVVERARQLGPVVAYVSRAAWNGVEPGDWEESARKCERAGAEIVLLDAENEADHRRFALEDVRRRKWTYCLTLDADEIPEDALLERLAAIAGKRLADRVHAEMETYFRDLRHVVRPPEKLAPIVMANFQVVEHRGIREYEGGVPIWIGRDGGVIHHLSWVGPDERIRRKLETSSHAPEFVGSYFERVYKGFEQDPSMRELHPTHPWAYQSVVRIAKPEILSAIPDPYPEEELRAPEDWPTLDVVVPVYGATEQVARLLDSLEKIKSLFRKVTVVDDASEGDEVREILDRHPWIEVLRNDSNLGFGPTCNRGFEAGDSQYVLFLNSDTVLTEAALVRMVECIESDSKIGLVGPYSNNAGHYQRVDAPYEDLDLEGFGRFALDCALSDREDRDVDMLTGFALLVRRAVLAGTKERPAELPFDDRFAPGQFEDNDLVHRALRERWRAVLCGRAFVWHEGSKTLSRLKVHPGTLLARNRAKFLDKWREDVRTGFASHLAGDGSFKPVVFDEDRRPEKLARRLAKRARDLRISVCIIVKDGGATLRRCLEGIAPFAWQIVVLDTGSTDDTLAVCQEFGAEVHHFEGAFRFDHARNQCLKHAKGTWVLVVDADDEVPLTTIEEMVSQLRNAPASLVGLYATVRFVDRGDWAGTEVVHLKVHRRIVGKWEYPIHEQLLPSLRKAGGELRFTRMVVLHSGYDFSPEGQAKKQARDRPLLALAVEERPGDPFPRYNVGMSELNWGNPQEAETALRECLALCNGQETILKSAYVLLGRSLEKQDRPEEALAVYSEGLGRVGDDPELSFWSGVLLCRMGRHVESLEMLGKVGGPREGSVHSYDVSIHYGENAHWRGRALASTGQWREGAHVLLEGAQTYRWLPCAFALFEEALVRGDQRAARAGLEAAFRLDGPSDTWVRAASQLHAESGGDVLQFLSDQLRTTPGAPAVMRALAFELIGRGRNSDARPLLDELAWMGDAKAAHALADLLFSEGEYPQAHQKYARALDLDPANGPAAARMAEIQAIVGVGSSEEGPNC